MNRLRGIIAGNRIAYAAVSHTPVTLLTSAPITNLTLALLLARIFANIFKL